MKTLLPFLFLLVLFHPASGNTFEFNENCKQAYREIFRLDLYNVSRYLEAEKLVNPGNSAIQYLGCYADFIAVFISEDPVAFDRFKNKIDERLLAVDQLPDKSPWKKMARGEMLLQYAILKFKWKENFSAGYYFRKSFKLLEENHKQFPAFSPNLKSLGFFHAAIGTVPENYKWIANLVGLRGTISQGAGELETVYVKVKKDASLNFMYDEVAFLRIFVASHLEKNYTTTSEIINDVQFSDNNPGPLHIFIETNTLVIEGKQKEALEKLATYKPGKNTYPLHYLDYMNGMIMLNKLDYDAEKYFTRYVTQFKGHSFVKSAWHKLAWIHYLKNDSKGFKEHMEMVKGAGNDFTDEDKQALKEALEESLPNKYLLRSRLLFDGSDYNNALTELTKAPDEAFPGLKEQVEFTYRLARIFDKKGQQEKALQYYTSTYENGRNREWYFAANAALLNGLIYESKNDTIKAREWYNKTLSLRNHEYQNSIDQKAEAGLNRMGK